MLQPKQKKFLKYQKNPINNKLANSSNKIKFGKIGLQSLEKGRITARQIETLRRTITGKMKRKGKVWIRIFPHKPITEKPTLVRMGKGKGPLNYWACNIKPGNILYEVSGEDFFILKQALKAASKKLGLKTRILFKDNKDL